MEATSEKDRQARAYGRARRWVRAFVFLGVVVLTGALAGWVGVATAIPAMVISLIFATWIERRTGLGQMADE